MLNLSLGLSLGSLATQRRGGWSPLSLGTKLLAWWDAGYGLTLAGNQVTAWADRKNGYAATQALSSARPTWAADGFGGAPGLTFDGNDDELTLANQPFPSAANASEIWGVVQQDALAADTGNRTVFSYGGGGETVSRRLYRTSGNSAQIRVGSGSGAVSGFSPAADFAGRKLVRGVIGASSTRVDIDGSAGAAATVVPNTGTTRARIGATDGASATFFWQGKMRDVIVTSPLTTDEAAKFQAFLLLRRAL